MRLTFYSKFLNIHQVAVADELYSLLGENFHFVATTSPRKEELKGASDCSSRCYCVSPYENAREYQRAMQLAVDSDVCVFGGFSMEYAIYRAKKNPSGLSFEMCERWLKQNWKNVLSPNLCRWWLNYMCYFRKANFYKLCASAFAAKDDGLLGAYKQRHYKWGYFVQPSSGKSLRPINIPSIKLMWCARFIDWKHPELAIDLAYRLVSSGYKCHLDMYGDGPLCSEIEHQVIRLGMSDTVIFHGNVPNEKIHAAMRECDIFLFTSDRQEGWGVVANEAMSNGAVVVGSDEIGAMPYLVTNGVTGMSFKSCCIDSLYESVKFLLDNPENRKQIAEAGRQTMMELWSPEHAAKSLLQLINDLNAGKETSIKEGPCSKA
jgi:glycosyltransferase involved in cell wall biosynthesis